MMRRVLRACALCLGVGLATLLQSCVLYGERLREVRDSSSNASSEQSQRSLQQQQVGQDTQPGKKSREPESATALPVALPDEPLAVAQPPVAPAAIFNGAAYSVMLGGLLGGVRPSLSGDGLIPGFRMRTPSPVGDGLIASLGGGGELPRLQPEPQRQIDQAQARPQSGQLEASAGWQPRLPLPHNSMSRERALLQSSQQDSLRQQAVQSAPPVPVAGSESAPDSDGAFAGGATTAGIAVGGPGAGSGAGAGDLTMGSTPATSVGPATQVAASEEKGNSAVSAPSTVEEGASFRALLRVSKVEMSELIAGLEADAPGNRAEAMQTAVSMAPVMVARISGVDFEVSPSDPQTQALNPDGDTTWEWDVKAKRSGVLTLVFQLSTNVVKNGQAAPRIVKHYRKKVDVKVNPSSMVAQHSGTILGMLATIVAALLTGWLTVRLQRGQEAKSSAAPVSTTVRQPEATLRPIAQLPDKKKPALPGKRRPGSRGR